MRQWGAWLADLAVAGFEPYLRMSTSAGIRQAI
jgi:hypothetical protein